MMTGREGGQTTAKIKDDPGFRTGECRGKAEGHRLIIREMLVEKSEHQKKFSEHETKTERYGSGQAKPVGLSHVRL